MDVETHGDLFCPMTLSAAGRPLLHDGEIELKTTEMVRIETDGRICLISISTLTVTNMRILLQYDRKGAAGTSYILLKAVIRVEDCATMLRSSKRLRFHFHDGRKLEFKFLGGYADKDSILDMANKSLQRKAWTAIEEAVARKQREEAEVQSFSARSAGVSGLIRRQEREHRTMDTVTKAAFTDLDALMNHAKDVVGIIERYAAVRFSKAEDQSDTSSEIGDATELESILQNIGIVSPVTKLSAGRLYHEQLARQIADLLLTENRIRRLGGMVSLADVYCLYNKARGTELVSPDDTYAAAAMLEKLRIGLKLRRFDSGVCVVQEYGHDDNAMSRNIQALASSRAEGVSATEVSHSLHMSIVVAKEQLLLAEQSGFLCRDDTINGIFFFSNKFNQ